MRRLLEADLKRVLVKILPWLLLALWLLFSTVSTINTFGESTDKDFFILGKIAGTYQFAMVIVGFAAILGIYADEFKSMVMIGVIGRGLSRDKFVFGKFLDLCIVTLLMQIVTIIYVMVIKAAFGATFTPLENKFLVISFVLSFIETITYVTIAAIFYFVSENAAVGLFAYLTFQMIIPVSLQLILQFTNLSKYHVERFYAAGMLSVAASDFIMGDVAGGLLYLLLEVIVYVLCALGITMLIFRKKELEF